MIRMAVVSTLAFVLSLAALSVTYAQTATPSPTTSTTTTVTPSPTSSTTVPQGAPSTGFGGN